MYKQVTSLSLLAIILTFFLTACQDEKYGFINSSSSDLWVNYHEEKIEIQINTKKQWEATLHSEWANLLTDGGGKGKNAIEIEFDKNTSSDKRVAILKLITDGEESTLTVIQRGKKEYEDITHCFYVHLGTFPVLYGGMHMLTHNKESYFTDIRETLDKSKYPAHVSGISANDNPYNIIKKIKEINDENPDAIFGYYTDDWRGSFVIPIFAELGIDTSRVKTTFFPDGLGTYLTLFNAFYGENSVGEVNYKKDHSELLSFVERCVGDASYSKSVNNKGWYDNLPIQWAHHMVANDLTKYYIQDKDYMISEDPYVKEVIKNTNYEIKTPTDLLASLSTEQQNKFYDMVGFTKETYKVQLDASPKPNLIIIGTSTSPNGVTAETQARYVQKVMDRYASTYDIFYKAHPADQAYLQYETQFPGLKLILPARMPFEVFTWGLIGSIDAIGGFDSTTFFSIPPAKVKFMFAKDAKDLGVVYEKIFADRPDIYWIN